MIGILVTVVWGEYSGNSGRAFGKIGSTGLGSYDSFVIVYNSPHRYCCWGPHPIKKGLCKAELSSYPGHWGKGKDLKEAGIMPCVYLLPQDYTNNFPCRNWLPPKGRGWEECDKDRQVCVL